MTECEKMRNDLKAYLDGQLSPAVRIAVRLHLNRCESCRKEMEEMRLMGTRMRAADSLEMSDALRTRILAAVPKAAPDAPVPMLPRWRERPVMIWGASASAALAWFILYPALTKSKGSPIPVVQPDASSRTLSIGTGFQQYTQDYDERPNLNFSAGNGTSATPYQVTHSIRAIEGNVGAITQTRALPPLIGTGNGNSKTLAPMLGIDGAGSQHDGGRRTQIAQATKSEAYENIETDPSHSNRSIPSNQAYLEERARNPWIPMRTTRGTLKPAPSSWHASAHFEEGLLTERQVHKDASLIVEVANAEQQSESVERLVKESKGYVAQNQLTTSEDNIRSASLTCKVPVDQFETVMGQITRLGLLKGKTLTGEDITDKVSDEQETGHVLRADIATTEEKLKVHRRHSETVRDEETLRSLRIRAAQSQARLKMLTKLGALAEITVELNEKPKNAPVVAPKPASPFMEEVSGTGQAAAHSFLMALRLPIQLLVWVVVYAPLWFLLFIAYRRFTR